MHHNMYFDKVNILTPNGNKSKLYLSIMRE